MDLLFCFLLHAILVSRLVFTFTDTPVSRRQTVFMIVLQSAALLAYELRPVLALLAGVLLLINILFHFLESRLKGRTTELRLLWLLAQIIVLGIFLSPWLGVQFQAALPNLLALIVYSFSPGALTANVDWLRSSVVLLGLLLVTNEVNILIRYLFKAFQLAPVTEGGAEKGLITIVNTREYNAGRVIGILERLLIYHLVLNAQFGAIGFILAAKSFTRFKELEKREFAEYVLVGTLLSALLAMAIAGWVGAVLG
ncbi:MAG: hypothetical protein MUQ10_16785 [Anaerolineae bacterium]|nr:hypothetical protein [Anaerolineae bacterium]